MHDDARMQNTYGKATAISRMALRICALLLHHGPKQKGHHWEQGKPLPDLKVVALIEQYATLTDALLVWVHALRAQVEKERRLADLEEVRIKERWEELKKEYPNNTFQFFNESPEFQTVLGIGVLLKSQPKILT